MAYAGQLRGRSGTRVVFSIISLPLPVFRLRGAASIQPGQALGTTMPMREVSYSFDALHFAVGSKLAAKTDCALKNPQILSARNFHRAELLQVWRLPLGVEQHEASLPESFHERH